MLFKTKNITKAIIQEFESVTRKIINSNIEIIENSIVVIISNCKYLGKSFCDIISKKEIIDNDLIEFKKDLKIVRIPESPASFPWLNVTENLKSFNSELSDAEIKNLIKFVGLDGYENHYPDNKSFGFRFRIALGRALAVKPDIIVMENSISNIKEIYLPDILELVEKSSKNTTFLIITNDYSQVSHLPVTFYLDKNGSLIRKERLEL